jgi:integrase
MQNTRESTWRETIRILGFHLSPEDPTDLEEVGGDVLKAFKGRKVQDVTKRDIVDLLNAVKRRDAPVMSNRVLAVLKKLFNWAAEEDIIEASPCAMVKPRAKETSRDRVLSDQELRLIWGAAHSDEGPFGQIVKLLVLTGQREGEVAALRWSELDLEGKTWTLPASRAKNAEVHLVPLSDSAVSILKSVHRIKSSDFVFFNDSGTFFSGFSRAKSRIDDVIAKANEGKPLPGWTIHDIRRTVATGLAQLGIEPVVIEKLLNHRGGILRGVAAIYQRYGYGKEKRTALNAWASHVESVFIGKQPTNVMPLRSAGE